MTKKAYVMRRTSAAFTTVRKLEMPIWDVVHIADDIPAAADWLAVHGDLNALVRDEYIIGFQYDIPTPEDRL